MTDEEDPHRRREATGANGVETVRNITLGTARAEDYSATDTAPVADASVDDLVTMLEHPDAPKRRRAVLALAEREPESAVLEILERLSLDDPDDEVRQFAIEAVAMLDGDPAVAVDVLASDEDPWVRAEATVALDRLDRAGYESEFVRLLDDDAAGVRRNALISLTRLRGDSAKPHLVDALDDPDDRVREWAAKLLGTIDDPAIDTVLEPILEDEDELDIVRETAARSLGARGRDVESLLETGSGTDMADDHMLNRVPDS